MGISKYIYSTTSDQLLGSCQLVTDLSFMLWTCYGEVANLLRTCYGETGVRDLGLYRTLITKTMDLTDGDSLIRMLYKFAY